MRTRLTIAASVTAAGLLLAGCGSAGDSEESMEEDMTSSEEMTEEDMASDEMDEEMSEEPMDEEMSGDEMDAESMDTPETLAFTATTLDGDEFDGASLAGSPAVLWFWAPWCPTCQAQIPNMTSLGEQYAGEVAVVGVGGLDTSEAIADLAGDIPNVQHLVDDEGEVWSHFGITQQSSFVVLDSDGEIVDEGTLSDEDLNATVAELADA
ncbi:redoxin domain-containing protein [Ruania alba]|uniref:Thiol-disulfide isomerase or thioredoxin n=1 Tax=Ruania alba TaxID=648782 RepID=A0A1H5LS55_9MICO|nr:redoxin domain-containing protein [Ruania alba]SEE79945.1 Thiol-disulfide isomerase or thioredoxin [Ruania alba]